MDGRTKLYLATLLRLFIDLARKGTFIGGHRIDGKIDFLIIKVNVLLHFTLAVKILLPNFSIDTLGKPHFLLDLCRCLFNVYLMEIA